MSESELRKLNIFRFLVSKSESELRFRNMVIGPGSNLKYVQLNLIFCSEPVWPVRVFELNNAQKYKVNKIHIS